MTAGESRPLAGRRILVTRTVEQAAPLVRGLVALGADVVAVPLIEILPPVDASAVDRAAAALDEYDWLVFTSANAVGALRDRLVGAGLPPRLPNATRTAVVGPATAAALSEHFPSSPPPVQPESDFRAEGLLAALAAHPVSGRRVLLPVSDRARETLARGLRDRGALVDAVVAYRTVRPAGAAAALRAALDRDPDVVVVFASPSAVEGFRDAGGSAWRAPVAVIGPVTERAALEAGLNVRVVASPATNDGLLAALTRHLTAR